MPYYKGDTEVRTGLAEFVIAVIDGGVSESEMKSCSGCIHQSLCNDEELYCINAIRGLVAGQQWSLPWITNFYIKATEAQR